MPNQITMPQGNTQTTTPASIAELQALTLYLSVIIDELRKDINLIDLAKIQSFFAMVSGVYAEVVPYFENFDTGYQLQAFASANQSFNDELMQAYSNQLDGNEISQTLAMYADLMSRQITDMLIATLSELSLGE